MFEAMIESIQDDVVRYMYRVNVVTDNGASDEVAYDEDGNPIEEAQVVEEKNDGVKR